METRGTGHYIVGIGDYRVTRLWVYSRHRITRLWVEDTIGGQVGI